MKKTRRMWVAVAVAAVAARSTGTALAETDPWIRGTNGDDRILGTNREAW